MAETLCCPCGTVLPLQTGPGRPRTYCSSVCSRHYRALGHNTTARTARGYQLSAYDYARLLVTQENKCAICGREEDSTGKLGTTKRLAVDHCHETGKVRGLLCQACNTAIGIMEDDTHRLRAAIAYIEQHA